MKKILVLVLSLLSIDAFASKKKFSSNVIEDQRSNIESVIDKCKFAKKDILSTVKAKVIGGGIVANSVGAVANTVGAIASFQAANKSKNLIDAGGNKGSAVENNKLTQAHGQLDESDKQTQNGVFSLSDANKNATKEDLNNQLYRMRMTSTIASGIATGAEGTAAVLTGTSVADLVEFVESVERCKAALDELEAE